MSFIRSRDHNLNATNGNSGSSDSSESFATATTSQLFCTARDTTTNDALEKQLSHFAINPRGIEEQDFLAASSNLAAAGQTGRTFKSLQESIDEHPVTHYVLVHVEPSPQNVKVILRILEGNVAITANQKKQVILGFHSTSKAKWALLKLIQQQLYVSFVRAGVVHLEDALVSRLTIDGFRPGLVSVDVLQANLVGFGPLVRVERLDSEGVSFVVEYDDNRDAELAVKSLHGRNLYGCDIRANLWKDGSDLDHLLKDSRPPTQKIQSQTHREAANPGSFAAVVQAKQSNTSLQPPETENTYVMPKPQKLTRLSNLQLLSEMKKRHSSTASVESENLENNIDIIKILNGQDPRTTFMIRNIPNKYTQDMLIELINESCRSTYDFVYLRMDFKNKCNVGYAFINFLDPKNVVSLVTSIVGKRWPKFNSEKVGTITYANIQGQEALISKFRDSTVMTEVQAYQPKLFKYGKEVKFPAPTATGYRRLNMRQQ